MAFIHYRTQGFVLKKEDLREADQVFSIFTKDFGKLEISSKAIRKIKSKLRSGIELFYLSEIEFIQGKAHKTLTDAMVIEKFKNIRQDLERLKIAHKIAELADDLVRDEEKDQEIWDLLNEVFEKLEIEKQPSGESLTSFDPALKIENCKLKIIYYYFLWNLLSILGYQIDLYNCANCQKKLQPKKLYFSLEEGGIICGECFSSFTEASEDKEITPDVIKIFRLFLKKDWEILLKLKITESNKKSLEKISEDYLSYYQKVE